MKSGPSVLSDTSIIFRFSNFLVCFRINYASLSFWAHFLYTNGVIRDMSAITLDILVVSLV